MRLGILCKPHRAVGIVLLIRVVKGPTPGPVYTSVALSHEGMCDCTLAGDLSCPSYPLYTCRGSIVSLISSVHLQGDMRGTIEKYQWTGTNTMYMVSSATSMSIGGGGGGPAIFLDRALNAGTSGECSTFGEVGTTECGVGCTAPLSGTPTFEVVQMEVWLVGSSALTAMRPSDAAPMIRR